jgi:hypothetical protein
MPFRPLDAIVALDRRLTPGPTAQFHQWYFEGVRRRSASAPTDQLTADIVQLKKGEPARVAIAISSIVEVFGVASLLAETHPVETAIGVFPVVALAIIVGPHRGMIKLRDREIMEDELNRRLGATAG